MKQLFCSHVTRHLIDRAMHRVDTLTYRVEGYYEPTIKVARLMVDGTPSGPPIEATDSTAAARMMLHARDNAVDDLPGYANYDQARSILNLPVSPEPMRTLVREAAYAR